MNSNKDIADHLEHLQSRIDLVQGTLDALAPMIVESVVRGRHPSLSGESLRAKLDEALDSYLEAQKIRTVKYSEFPFLSDEPPPDTSSPEA